MKSILKYDFACYINSKNQSLRIIYILSPLKLLVLENKE
jgi:hypothetical protein